MRPEERRNKHARTHIRTYFAREGRKWVEIMSLKAFVGRDNVEWNTPSRKGRREKGEEEKGREGAVFEIRSAGFCGVGISR